MGVSGIVDENTPSDYGEMQFVLPISPISAQAKADARKSVTDAVQEITQTLNFVLLGDIGIEIEWMVPSLLRYEADVSPDLENITKPLLDALCGPNGVIIDDCQVKSFGSEWLDWRRDDQRVKISLRYAPGEWTLKSDLIFVQIERGLCIPLECGFDSPILGTLLDAYEAAFSRRRELLDLGFHTTLARDVLPCCRLFHRTRIRDYRVFPIQSLRES